ncbi:hypothetical protein KO02_23055 [Sphingobacterium sp. ML3W]|uniref:MauE/DoxX family redox-associated membrane protein n=1 Tax=Sphingobacterium sp. ML3W TaxID=1538644 RepID=UPI0004F7C66F|nr:MauE/DoxX family redox-associated membrane protein [Sphingobacterium sp. ML3W]AIM39243.1 hypothetical protein KO02_23055 [Sphingobacterium sp. ML3W]
MKKNSYIFIVVQYSFILLWGSSATLKLLNISETKQELLLQPFPIWMCDILWWLLPVLHIALVLVLLYRPAVSLGIKLSTMLITMYTLYLLIGVTKLMGSTPCTCAGLWPTNNHWLHIILNSIFIILGILYWILAHKSHNGKDVNFELGRREDVILS